MKSLGSTKNFLAIDEKYSSLENSKIAIVSAPYEHTSSYGGGAANGPEEILKASSYVEFYDDELDRELCFEYGIATLEPLKFDGIYDRKALEVIQSNVKYLLELNKFVVTIGGEHTISTAPIAAHFEKFPNMSILHLDAHSDLRDEYENSKYSHACFMSRVAEFFPPERIVQVGIRAQCIEEAQFIRDKGIKTFYASGIRKGKYGSYWQSEVINHAGEEIYVTLDLDFLDPAIMPATGTPEPDGFLYNETLEIFREIMNEGRRIIGFDVVELAPIPGLHHPNLTAARIIYKILNYAFECFERK